MATLSHTSILENMIRTTLEASVDFTLPGYPASFMEIHLSFEDNPDIKRFIYKVYRCRSHSKDLDEMAHEFVFSLRHSIQESGEGRKCILWRRKPIVEVKGDFEKDYMEGWVSVRFSVFDENWDELEIDSPYLAQFEEEVPLWEKAA